MVKMIQEKSQKSQKVAIKYFCEKCDYNTSKIYDWNKHLTTAKHKMITNDTNDTQKSSKSRHLCECGKSYKHHSGLSRHKNVCTYKKTEEASENLESENNDMLVDYLMKENKEMKTMMVEMCKQMQSHNTTNNNTNNIVNINMFLNEQCKDAMNMSEFIESIQLNLEDITKIGEKGQVEGMANILVDKLNALDIFKRPVHCSDTKTETIYVKDKNKWEKEKKEKPKLKHAIDELTKKSIQSLPYLEDSPDKYVKTISEVLKDPREDKKIISEIAKNVCVASKEVV
jgi:hypothetical protein